MIKDTSIENFINFYPSVVIYHNGKVHAYLDATKDNDLLYYKSIEGFKEWLTKYVLLKFDNSNNV